jgi:hypothetical protein
LQRRHYKLLLIGESERGRKLMLAVCVVVVQGTVVQLILVFRSRRGPIVV